MEHRADCEEHFRTANISWLHIIPSGKIITARAQAVVGLNVHVGLPFEPRQQSDVTSDLPGISIT